MMNRTLKRPMFRMGGSSGTGITSGLDNTQEFRPGFRKGTSKYGMGQGSTEGYEGIFPPKATFASDMIADRKQPITQSFNTATDAQRRIDLVNQIAPRTTSPFSPGSLSGFLTSTGLNLLSATPRGNIFATAAGAAKDPFDAFTTARGKQSAEDRALALAAAQASIARGDTLSDIERKEEFEKEMATQAVKDERELQEFIYDKKLEIEKVKGEYDVKAEAAGGGDNRLNIEVTNDLITGASRSIFDATNTLNSGVKLVDGQEVPLTETEKRELNQIVRENELFLEKQLGLPPEYAAILQSPERYDNAKRSAVNEENIRRKEEWLAANPKQTGESGKDYQKRFQEGVKEIDLYSQEADTIAQEYIRKQYYTYAKGGRVGYQMGGGADMSQQSEAMEQESPVQNLSYSELRARLPRDIDNEIVILLANSKQALLDFANIKTPQDIASFNQQYDVNLTLPQGA